jgi:hypothetical protein
MESFCHGIVQWEDSQVFIQRNKTPERPEAHLDGVFCDNLREGNLSYRRDTGTNASRCLE